MRLALRVVLVCAACTDLGSGTTPPQPPVSDRLLWSVPSARAYGQPAYGAGRVFVSTMDHFVVALDARTAQRVWRTKLADREGPPAGQGCVFRDGRVVVGDVGLFALDAESGAILWRFSPEVGRNVGLFLPEIAGGTVYAGSSSGHVFAIDLSSGAQIWRASVSDRDTVSVYHPRVVAGRVLVAFTEFGGGTRGQDVGGLAALDASTGRIIWRSMLPTTGSPSNPTATIEPEVLNGVVIAGSRDGPVHALATEDGRSLWSSPAVATPSGGSPEVQDYRPLGATSSLFIVGSVAKVLLGLDPATGTVRWRYDQVFGSTGWIGVSKDEVYLVYGGGQFDVIDGSNGALLWRSNDRFASFPPAVADSLLVVAGDGVHAYRR